MDTSHAICFFFPLLGGSEKHFHLLLLRPFCQILEPIVSHQSKGLHTPAKKEIPQHLKKKKKILIRECKHRCIQTVVGG